MFVTKEEYKDRYLICKTCTSFVDEIKICRECGCFMPLKAKLGNSTCPKDKWGMSPNPTDIEPLTELKDLEQ
jgi:hypothetical protein